MKEQKYIYSQATFGVYGVDRFTLDPHLASHRNVLLLSDDVRVRDSRVTSPLTKSAFHPTSATGVPGWGALHVQLMLDPTRW
jgi:hypothetical protein